MKKNNIVEEGVMEDKFPTDYKEFISEVESRRSSGRSLIADIVYERVLKLKKKAKDFTGVVKKTSEMLVEVGVTYRSEDTGESDGEHDGIIKPKRESPFKLFFWGFYYNESNGKVYVGCGLPSGETDSDNERRPSKFTVDGVEVELGDMVYGDMTLSDILYASDTKSNDNPSGFMFLDWDRIKSITFKGD